MLRSASSERPDLLVVPKKERSSKRDTLDPRPKSIWTVATAIQLAFERKGRIVLPVDSPPADKRGRKQLDGKQKKQADSLNHANQVKCHIEDAPPESELIGFCVFGDRYDGLSVYGLGVVNEPVFLGKLDGKFVSGGCLGLTAVDNKLFLIGGEYSVVKPDPRDVWIFDCCSSQKNWEKGPDLLASKPNPFVFAWHHKVYALAGSSGFPPHLLPHEYVMPNPLFEFFDISSRVWSPLPSPPFYDAYKRIDCPFPEVISYAILDDILHLIMVLGSDDATDLYCFNLSRGEWCPHPPNQPLVIQNWRENPRFPPHMMGGKSFDVDFSEKDPSVYLYDYNVESKWTEEVEDLDFHFWSPCHHSNPAVKKHCKELVPFKVHGLEKVMSTLPLDNDTLRWRVSLLDEKRHTFCIVFDYWKCFEETTTSRNFVCLCTFKLDFGKLSICGNLPNASSFPIHAQDVRFKTFELDSILMRYFFHKQPRLGGSTVGDISNNALIQRDDVGMRVLDFKEDKRLSEHFWHLHF